MRRTILSLVLIILVTLATSQTVSAQNYGLYDTAKEAGLLKYGGSAPQLIGNVIGAGLSMVSVVFFALMIYGGIRYMTARGDEDITKKAVNTIYAAIIGILIVLASYALTNFVFNSLGSQTAAPSTNESSTSAEYHCTNNTTGQCIPLTKEQYDDVELILNLGCVEDKGPCP